MSSDGKLIQFSKKDASVLKLRLTRMSMDIATREVASEDVTQLIRMLRGNILNGTSDKLFSPQDYEALLAERRALIGGVSLGTGFEKFDKSLGPIRQGNVISIGARTGVGKTSFMVNLSLNISSMGHKVLYFSTEMTTQEIVFSRLLPAMRNAGVWKFEPEKLDTEIVKEALNEFQLLKFLIDQDSHPDLERIERMIELSGAKVVFIDYLQRCNLPAEENHRLRVQSFMRNLKNLCKDKGVVAFVASQLSREVESRKEDRPRVSDLSESGAIENESDKVLLLWIQPAQRYHAGEVDLDLIVAKNRQGRSFNHSLKFMRPTQRIRELAEGESVQLEIPQKKRKVSGNESYTIG